MDEDSAYAIAQLRQMPLECLVPAMLEVRAEMLNAGEAANDVAAVIERMCGLLGVDPGKLRGAMN